MQTIACAWPEMLHDGNFLARPFLVNAGGVVGEERPFLRLFGDVREERRHMSKAFSTLYNNIVCPVDHAKTPHSRFFYMHVNWVWACMCICVHVYVRGCMCVHLCAFTCACIHVCVRACKYASVRIYIYASCVCAHVCVCIHTCVPVSVCTCVCEWFASARACTCRCLWALISYLSHFTSLSTRISL